MVEMGSNMAAPTDTAREKEQHHREILYTQRSEVSVYGRNSSSFSRLEKTSVD